LEYKAPLLQKHKMPGIQGVATFVPKLTDTKLPDPKKMETKGEKQARRKAKLQKRGEERVKRQIAKWDPKTLDRTEKATKDAYKTLFVGRLSFELTEDDLKQEFEYYGPIVKVHLVRSKKGKSRGYGFVEFESSRDLKEAYKDADGRKIGGRRIVVDVERGRTFKNWRPRRLGGGLGATRVGGKEVNQKTSGREPPAGSAPSSRRSRSPERTSHRSSRSDRSSDHSRGDRSREDRTRGGGDKRDRPSGGGGGGGSSSSSSSRRPRSRSPERRTRGGGGSDRGGTTGSTGTRRPRSRSRTRSRSPQRRR